MNDRVYRVLEFDRVKELLGKEAISTMAKAAVVDIVPITEEHKIREMLAETDEAVSVILHKGTIPLGGLYDVKKSVRYAEKGGVLTTGELLSIMQVLRCAREVLDFLDDGALGSIPKIEGYTQVINAERALEDHIDRCIESEEQISDNASPLLRDIRRKIISQSESARSRMQSMVSSSVYRDMLADTVVTMRDGRLVIPVKSENRARFPGIIHDRSATGSTLFIEPQAIVNINNEIRELELKEREEIHRILAELSAECGKAVRHIINNQKYLTRLDVIFAKAKLSLKYNGCSAAISRDGSIDIRKGRHPLLDPEKAVPISLSLGRHYRTLIITGPNTGGKTVTLKTVGLMMLMNQAGLHVPAGDGTYLPIMKKIYADIGDEQSIEQSLSTFSSHMKNVVEIMGQADEETFVLLDELGAGTDPTEGAALAIAELEHLADRGSLVMATTHYSELKKYALSTSYVENASMEFNVETLSPTYRLTIGTPGKSNAFEISRKLGLDEAIIEDAKSRLGSEDIEFENIISAIEEDRTAAQAERGEAEDLRQRMESLEKDLTYRQEQADEKRRRMIEKARQEAFDIVAEARQFAEDIKAELKELEAQAQEGELAEDAQQRQQSIKYRLKKKSDEYREVFKPAVNAKPASRSELKIGDRVNVVSMGQKGNVVTLPDARDNLMVQIGLMKVNVSLADITKIDKNGVQKKFEKTKYARMYRQKTMSVETSINVIGKTLDDAIMEVDKYLDDAFMSGLPQVQVIHGRGTGRLKNGLKPLFRRHRHVDSFRPGDYHEGGDGVTVVVLKQE